MADFIPTRVSRVKKDAVKEFLSVNYEGPKKKIKGNVVGSEERQKAESSKSNVTESKESKYNDEKKKQELEMKRVRYEVMKFGMSGFEKVKANEAKVALAISLGAKPPKNTGINYKVLQRQRKEQKRMEKNEERTSGLEKSMIKYKTKKIHRKDSSGILGVYGKANKKALSKIKK